MLGTPPKRSLRLASVPNLQRRSASPAVEESAGGPRHQTSRSSRSLRSSLHSGCKDLKDFKRVARGADANRAVPRKFTNSQDDGGTGGSHSATAARTENHAAVRGGTRSPDCREDSWLPLNHEAREWLEENSDRLSAQTQKCLLIHEQLISLLKPLLGHEGAVSRADAGVARPDWEELGKPLSRSALEGAPIELLGNAVRASARRQDELRSELATAEETLQAARAQYRMQDVATDKFEQALEAGSEAEMRRLREQAAALEARLHDRLEALQHLASQTVARPQSPIALSSPPRGFGQPCHSPIRSYNGYKVFNTKARSVSPPRHQSSTACKPLVPQSRAPSQPRVSGSPRAVSTPVVVARPCVRVAAAAAAVARHQATLAHPLQQLDDARHRAQVEFWSGTI
ncbi:Comt, partial [Symbiodinium pilosum]